MARAVVIALIGLLALAGCAGSDDMSNAPSEPPTIGIPHACLGLEEPDCSRALEAALAELGSADGIAYAEVGPFGCPNDAGCPNTLSARPSGQVVFEPSTGDPVAISVNAVADGSIATVPGEWFAVAVAPSSTAGQLGGQPVPYSLGHCGLLSGVDVDGSWWDPVGFVNVDHPDAINAANGTFTATDPNHATFTSAGGFTVNLVRRIGDKHLPLCA